MFNNFGRLVGTEPPTCIQLYYLGRLKRTAPV